ncbi:MAG: T9SS type A sorting domain-containing protein [Chitinophagales bacterium]|nr:T9SS type A sorting domain-containing protein [Chitinophagales bacterium]
MKKFFSIATLCGLFLLQLHAYAQQVPTETSPLGAPRIVNFAALAAEEALHPHLVEPRDFEADEEAHTGMPVNMPVPRDAVKNYVEIPAEGLRATSPAPVASFNGLLDNGQVIPPDVQGAAGPNHLMEMLNSTFRVFNKTGGTVSTVSISTFYGFSSSNFYSDPRITYDPYNDRWISCLMADVPGGHNGVYVAVSQTSDPTGTWNIYNFDATGNNSDIFDYPAMGFNKDWVVITGNVFNGSSVFQKVKVLVFDKAAMYANTSSTVTTFSDNSIFTLQPAVTYDNTVGTVYMVTNWNANSGGFGYLKLFTISGSVSAPVYTAGNTVGVNQTWSTSSKTAPQLGSSNKISTNDTRVQNAVYRNGYLYCSQTVYLPTSSANRASVQWWQIDPSNSSVAQFGRVDDATGTNFYAFPSITVNANDDVLVGYSTFSSSIYASSAYSFRTANDALNTLQDPYLYKAGLATYYKTFGGSSNRWGDYSACVVDPVDGSFWTLQEFANSPSNNWGTAWANVAASNVAVCSVPASLASSNITQTSADVSWGAVSGASSYTLQYKLTSSGTWTQINTSSTSQSLSGLTSGAQYEFQVQASCTNGGTSAFSASALFTTQSNACTDTYEPNNSKNQAKAITAGVTIQALIGNSTDKDFFSFSNTSGQPNIRVSLTNLPANYNLKLFNPSGSQIAQSTNSGTTNETVKYNTATVGTYKAQVLGVNGAFNSTTCYSLIAEISSTPWRLDGEETAVANTLTSIYPNPSDGHLTAAYTSAVTGNVSVSVTDLFGKQVLTESLEVSEGMNALKLDMATAPNGFYLIRIISGNETCQMKFQIER